MTSPRFPGSRIFTTDHPTTSMKCESSYSFRHREHHPQTFIGFRGPAGRQGLGRIMKRGKETTDGRGYPNPYATRDRRARESRSVAERAERTTPPRTRRILEGSAKNSRAILPLRLSVQFSSVLQFTSVQFNSGRLKLSALSRQPRAVGLRSGC